MVLREKSLFVKPRVKEIEPEVEEKVPEKINNVPKKIEKKELLKIPPAMERDLDTENPAPVIQKVEPKKAVKKEKLGRNDPCWCGSGKKWKKCHYPQLSN